jgi:hypothetical protein
MLKTTALPALSTAWYNKKGEASFSDMLALLGVIFRQKSILTTQQLHLTIMKLTSNNGKPC